MDEIITLLQLNKKGLLVISLAIVLDIISGVIKASLNGELRSASFRTGLTKKVLDYVLIVTGFSLDYLMGVQYIGTATLYSLCAMEFYSVLENVKEYLPLPEAITKALDVLQSRGKEE